MVSIKLQLTPQKANLHTAHLAEKKNICTSYYGNTNSIFLTFFFFFKSKKTVYTWYHCYQVPHYIVWYIKKYIKVMALGKQ